MKPRQVRLQLLGREDYIISLEALFSKDKHTPLRVTLSDYTAIFWKKKSEREDVNSYIKEIYDIRSAFFHSGVNDILGEHTKRLEEILATIIINVIDYSMKRKVTSDKEFFSYLTKVKIGCI